MFRASLVSLLWGLGSAPWIAALFAATLLSVPNPLHSQDDIRQLKLRDWAPRSMLVVPQHQPQKPKFPTVDVHNHLGGGKQTLTPERVAGYLTEMNEAGVRTVVNLDGGWGERLKETLDVLDNAHPGRFLTFALLDFNGIDDEGWTDRETNRLEESFRNGAKGLKFHKSLGLSYRYKDGKLMPVDDPKLSQIFKLCGRKGKPVMIHTADPAAFFTPLDRYNERWHELNEHPNWLFYGEQFPAREELLRQFTRVVERHPETTFIGAHFGNNVEDLATVGGWLDRYPNLYVDIDARISELGRQPYSARKFFLKYSDRIMFGTDTTPRRNAFRIYYRFLETDDEYFDCAESHHLQGFWMIYGIYLPEEVLEQVYYKNAERVLGGDLGRTAAKQPDTPAASGDADSRGRTREPIARVLRTADFEITGDGGNAAWKAAAWHSLAARGNRQSDAARETRFKVLYSDRGLYVLLHGADDKITATLDKDFTRLWTEDVFEFFLWTDESQPIYFEYEISPLGYELPILCPNNAPAGKDFLRWLPWNYEGERKISKKVAVEGGEARSGATIRGWSVEIFLPYATLNPLLNLPPRPGTKWRANFYRMDYDDPQPRAWDWARVGNSFHEFQKFGTLSFE